MSNANGSKWIMAGALVLSGAIVACSDSGASGEKPIMVAAVTESVAPVVENKVDTPVVKPRPVNVKYEDAETFFRKGRYADAFEHFTVYVEEHPENGFGHYMLGLSAWKMGDHETASRELGRAVELDSSSVKARTNLARVLLERGLAVEALPQIQAAVELAPESHETWRVLGNAYAQLGDTEAAMHAFREAMLLNRSDAWTMNNYGLLLIRLGRYEDALGPLARAVELKPQTAVFQNNLGIAYENSGWLGGARSAFTAALDADSTYTKAKVSLERVQSVLGDATDESPDVPTLARRFVEEMEQWAMQETDVDR